MWFGLQNTPATFQCFMNHVLREEIAGGHVQAYVNDVIVFAEDLATHQYWMDWVLKRMGCASDSVNASLRRVRSSSLG